MYRKGFSNENELHMLLFICILSKRIQLELIPYHTIKEFIRVFKGLIQQRGVLKIYSSNANTFITSCKWVEMLNKSEALNHIVNINKI